MPLPTTHVPLRQNIAGCTPGNYTRPLPIYPLSFCVLSSHVGPANARSCQRLPTLTQPVLWWLCGCVLADARSPPAAAAAAVGHRSQSSSAHLITIHITRLARPAKHSPPSPKAGWRRTNRLLDIALDRAVSFALETRVPDSLHSMSSNHRTCLMSLGTLPDST